MKLSVGQRIWVFLACGFGAGYFTRFPGTFASILICPLIWVFASFLGEQPYLWAGIFLCLFGILVCQLATQYLGQKDPKQIVWDEFAGMWLAMVYIPMTLTNLALAFCLFRLLDISKPPPISTAEKRFSGGVGVMLDDIIAGIGANLILRLVLLVAEYLGL